MQLKSRVYPLPYHIKMMVCLSQFLCFVYWNKRSTRWNDCDSGCDHFYRTEVILSNPPTCPRQARATVPPVAEPVEALYHCLRQAQAAVG